MDPEAARFRSPRPRALPLPFHQLTASPSYSPPDGLKDIAGNLLPADEFTSTSTSRF